MQTFIPATMMTQHPDSAMRYVSVRDEPAEAIDALTPQPVGLGLEEVMVDYEGKLTPYHQTAEIALGLSERGIVPGEDVLVTPRIPSAGKETVFHQLMALMSIIESNFKLSEGGGRIGEVVVPMVETAAELVAVRRRIEDVIDLGHKEFGIPRDPDEVQVIPLIEEVPELLGAGELLDGYLEAAADAGYGIGRLRVMFGRSDSAMVYGLVPSVLAVKVAIADCHRRAADAGKPLFPILGGGVLPFRGHVSLDNLERLAEDYAGTSTITIQSGLRYDCGSEAARQMALRTRELLEARSPLAYDDEERRFIEALIGIFTIPYLESFSRLIGAVTAMSDLIPRRRDRLARKSAVGYARDAARPEKLAARIGDGEVAAALRERATLVGGDLPRAISFTAALYSMGLPPEFIGTGRGLVAVRERFGQEGIDRLQEIYPGLADSMKQAARFAAPSIAAGHLDEELMDQVRADFEAVEGILGIAAGPRDDDDRRYHMLLETLQPMIRQLVSGGKWYGDAADADLVSDWVSRLGRLRGSLG